MHVVLIATGGTIASVRGEDGLRRASLRADDLLERVPGLQGRADVRTLDVATVNGWALTGAQMLDVADRVRTLAGEADVGGVVVTHGTDTIEETAFLTDLWLGEAGDVAGVVFTGAMRAADELSSDGERNLDNAVRVAADPASRGRGVLLCFDDHLHAARHLTKVSSSGVGALRSANGPVGTVQDGVVQFWGQPWRPPPPGDRVELEVPAFMVYPGMDGRCIDLAVEAGARGVVVEGTGLGNVPPQVAEAIGRALARDVPVVVTSRPPGGAAGAVYGGDGGGGSLAAMGAVFAGDLPAHKARIALTVALGVGRTPDEVSAWFARL